MAFISTNKPRKPSEETMEVFATHLVELQNEFPQAPAKDVGLIAALLTISTEIKA